MIIKELNLLIATHILQGHKCNAKDLCHYIFCHLKLCSPPLSFNIFQNHKAVYSQHFGFVLT